MRRAARLCAERMRAEMGFGRAVHRGTGRRPRVRTDHGRARVVRGIAAADSLRGQRGALLARRKFSSLRSRWHTRAVHVLQAAQDLQGGSRSDHASRIRVTSYYRLSDSHPMAARSLMRWWWWPLTVRLRARDNRSRKAATDGGEQPAACPSAGEAAYTGDGGGVQRSCRRAQSDAVRQAGLKRRH